MERINETQPIRTILERATNVTRSHQLVPDYLATVVEITRTDEIEDLELFEGTLLYFPGVKAADLTT